MKINFQNLNYTPKFHKNDTNKNTLSNLCLKPELTRDTVSFGNKIDLLKLPQKQIINRILSTIDNFDNFLGVGGEASVYRIQNSDYCIRIPFTWLKNNNFEKFDGKIDFNISEKEKVNHVVGKFGENSKKTPTIMHYIQSDNIYNAEQGRNIMIQMPQEAFDDLHKQICNAANNGMVLDVSWKNIIYDTKNKKMTAIDFNEAPWLTNQFLTAMHSILTAYYATGIACNKKINSLCAKKILNSVLKDFEPDKSLQTDISNYNFGHFLNSMNKLGCINSTDKKLLKLQFNELIDLKCKQLQEKDKPKELLDKIKIIKTLIEQNIK